MACVGFAPIFKVDLWSCNVCVRVCFVAVPEMAFVKLTSGEVVRTGNAATRRKFSRYAQQQTTVSSSKQESGLKAELKELEKDMNADFDLEGVDPDSFLMDDSEHKSRKKKRRHVNKVCFYPQAFH